MPLKRLGLSHLCDSEPARSCQATAGYFCVLLPFLSDKTFELLIFRSKGNHHYQILNLRVLCECDFSATETKMYFEMS